MHDEKWRQIPVSEKVPSNSGWLVVGLVLGHQRRQLLGFAVTERSGWRNKSPKHSPGTRRPNISSVTMTEHLATPSQKAPFVTLATIDDLLSGDYSEQLIRLNAIDFTTNGADGQSISKIGQYASDVPQAIKLGSFSLYAFAQVIASS
jgi:hypothetical protein